VVLHISPFLRRIGGTTLSLIERRCSSSGQKSMLRSGAMIGICRAVKLSLSRSALVWRRLGTAPTAVSLSGGGEQLTKLRHCLRNLALYQSSGACHVEDA